MKRIRTAIATFIMVLSTASVILPASSAFTAPLDPCSVNPSSSVCNYQNTRGDSRQIIKNIVNLLLYIVGVSAVIVIIISGIKYTTSAGDAGQVANAKRTLLYAVVGLAVAMLAYVIVNWVFRTVNS